MKNKKILLTGSYSVAVTAIVIAVVIALNLLVGQLPTTITKPDTTPEKLATVGADSKKVLKKIESDINIYLIFSESNVNSADSMSFRDTRLEELLDKYEDANSKIKVTEVDPVKDPTFIKKYTDDTLSQNSLIIVSDKRATTVSGNAYYMYEIAGYEGQYFTYEEYQMMSQQMQYYYGQTVDATAYFFAENEITAALDYVTHDVLPVVYELSGHGETSISSTSYGTLLADENVELKSLELLKGESVSVPEDCEALIITAPQTDISKEESEAIIKYLDGGGQVMFVSYIAYYTAEAMPNMASVCSHMGLKAVEEIIVESDTEGYFQYPYYLIPKVTGNGITAGFDSNLYLFMVESHAITAVADAKNVNVLPLLETTEGAYFYNEQNATDPDKADKDKFTLAYQSTVTGEDGKDGGTLYWFATLAFLDESFYNYGNSKLFSKIIVETCDKPTSVSIIGKELSTSYLTINEMTANASSIAVCAIIPLIALAIGFYVWIKRRSK